MNSADELVRYRLKRRQFWSAGAVPGVSDGTTSLIQSSPARHRLFTGFRNRPRLHAAEVPAVITHRLQNFLAAVLTFGCCGSLVSAATYDQCIVALNASASGALSISGSANVSAPGCG